MKKTLLALLAMTLLCSGAFAQYPAVDAFSGAGPVGLGSNWTTINSGTRITGVIQKNAGVLSFSAGSGGDPIAISYYSAVAFSSDQSSQFVIGPDTTYNSNSSPIIHVQATTGNGYTWHWDSASIEKWTGGTPTDITMTKACPTVNLSDVAKIASVGSTIYCIDVTTGGFGYGTDSTYTGGAPGIMIGSYSGHLLMSGPFKGDCFPYSCNSVEATPYSPLYPWPSIIDYYSASAVTVTLTGQSAGWVIGYTTDGSTPTATTAGTITHGTTYSAPFSVSATGLTTVKTIATEVGQVNSIENDYTYNVGYQIPVLNGVQMFPSNSIFNTRVDSLPVDSTNNTAFQSGYAGSFVTHNWDQGGTVGVSGIPWNAAVAATPQYMNSSWTYGESENGPYYILNNTNIENVTSLGCTNTNLLSPSTTDYHNLTVVNLGSGAGQLQEIYQASCVAGSPNVWTGASGAIWDLTSNALRTNGWTSGDAAGLPMTPFLIKYDEVASGNMPHPSRFTLHSVSSSVYEWPGRHSAGSGGLPLGLRIRLKASFDISGFSAANQVILTSWKQYGVFLADTGQTGYIQGVTDPRWNEADLNKLNAVALGNFEVVDESGCQVGADSGQSSCGAAPPTTGATIYGTGYLYGTGSIY